ncbi:MAG: hypothetical protein P8Y44_11530 [Acidobacteriota bacterium]
MDIGKIFSSRWGAVGATGALLVGLLLLNAAAIREIVAARKEARQIAQHELELRLEGRGQALRARLADLRSDLVALAESAPFKGLAERMVSTDPLVRRWARLDAEGSLLLFAQSRPAVQVIWLTIGGAGDVVVGRHGGVAVVVDPQTVSPPRRDGVTLMQMSLGSEPQTSLRGWVDPILILDDWTDFSGADLSLQPTPPRRIDGGGIAAAVEIEFGALFCGISWSCWPLRRRSHWLWCRCEGGFWRRRRWSTNTGSGSWNGVCYTPNVSRVSGGSPRESPTKSTIRWRE